MVRIQDGTPPERLRRIIGRFSSNNHGCILFQRMFIDKDRENALSLASDMNAMYAHYDAVLAGLRLRHAMSEL